MNNKILTMFFLLIILSFSFCSSNQDVSFVQKEHQIDVLINGKLFTTYLYKPNLTKPILYPVLSPSGIVMNRSYPFKKVEGESDDHPHQAGIFFTYDEVNEDGFWNNATYPPQIKHAKVTQMNGGNEKGTLSTVMLWVGEDGKTLLQEDRTMIFYPGDDFYTIDFTMTLTAKDTSVVFHYTKEGMFAIRVAHWLREKGGSGRYLSSNDEETEKDVWGKRAKWVRLEGEKKKKTIGIAIFNHPTSTNFPTFWHARGYGLFSANPLGQFVFQKSRGNNNPEKFELKLEKNESAVFKFRMIFYEGSWSKEQFEKKFMEYAGQ